MMPRQSCCWQAVAALVGLCLAAPLLQGANPSGVVALYEANRKEGVPNYVTQDVFLVAYQDLSRQELMQREQLTSVALDSWVKVLQNKAVTSETQQQGAADMLAVLAALGGGGTGLSNVATAELALIDAGEGLAESPLWGTKIDYSQFIPRGRYAGDEATERYFRQIRYLNSTLFHVNPSKATGVTPEVSTHHMAMLQALLDWGAAGDAYGLLLQSASGPGTLDDLSLLDAAAITDDNLAAGLRVMAARDQRYPAVLQGYVERTALAEGETAGQALLGVRLLPGWVGADTLAMQFLVNDAGSWTGKGEQPFSAAAGGGGVVKGWPTANEVLVAMAVTVATGPVSAAGDDQFANYSSAAATAAAAFSERPVLEQANWNLHRAVAGSRENTESALMTARALWTLQRHESVLYSKQSYTPVDRSMGAMIDRSQSTIEPAVVVYRALSELVALRQKTAPDEFAERWQALANMVSANLALAEKLTAGEVLSLEEGDQLADIDLALKAIGIQADLPVAVDVHTHPGEGMVLQQATAWPVIETHSDGRGARLSHREFKQNIGERLTDEAWRQQLREHKASQQ